MGGTGGKKGVVYFLNMGQKSAERRELDINSVPGSKIADAFYNPNRLEHQWAGEATAVPAMK
ncbi:MAG: hypothetical protein AMXMBFR84_13420 [Candidatus Hydrogenedentota bacterium]